VNPGDWLVGDDDGVVVISPSKLESALELGRRIVSAEKVIEKQIRAGKDIAGLIGTEAAIERKRAGVLIPQLRGPGGQTK
jgi:regulator of RNase E activity RraA